MNINRLKFRPGPAASKLLTSAMCSTGLPHHFGRDVYFICVRLYVHFEVMESMKVVAIFRMFPYHACQFYVSVFHVTLFMPSHCGQ